MRRSDKTLTYEEAKELKWFCRNVVGVRNDMYDVSDCFKTFNDRISRLEKTCELIEKFLGEKIEAQTSPFLNEFKVQDE